MGASSEHPSPSVSAAVVRYVAIESTLESYVIDGIMYFFAHGIKQPEDRASMLLLWSVIVT